MNDFSLDVSLAHELKNSLRHNGWDEEMLTRALPGDFFGKVSRVLSGQAHIVESRPTVALDAAPLTPRGWQMTHHKRMGQFEWNPAQVLLQPLDGEGSWDRVMERIRFSSPLNATGIDFLLDHSWLIPDNWPENVFFLGTRYRNGEDLEAVRYLALTGAGWVWRPCILEEHPQPFGHAAIVYTGC